jgi:hypothetical protein
MNGITSYYSLAPILNLTYNEYQKAIDLLLEICVGSTHPWFLTVDKIYLKFSINDKNIVFKRQDIKPGETFYGWKLINKVRL